MSPVRIEPRSFQSKTAPCTIEPTVTLLWDEKKNSLVQILEQRGKYYKIEYEITTTSYNVIVIDAILELLPFTITKF